MELLRCDSCGRPLSEGAVRRGDAELRGALLVCRTCLAVEAGGHRLPVDPSSPSARAWEQWYATRDAETDTEPTVPMEGLPELAPAGSSAPILPKPRSSRDKRVTAKLPAARPREVQYSTGGQAVRSPYLLAAMILLAVVLPAFAVSLWIAVSGQSEQQRLRGEVDLARAQTMDERGELNRRINMLEERLGSLERMAREQRDAAPVPVAPAPSSTPQPSATAPQPVQPQPSASRGTLPVTPLDDAERQELDQSEQELADRLSEALGAAKTHAERMMIVGDIIVQRAHLAAPRVRVLLRSTNSGERAIAAIALGVLGDRESIAELQKIASADDAPEVRDAASRAISQIRGVAGVPELRGITDQQLAALESQLAAAPSSDLLASVKAEILRRRGVRRE